MLTSMVTGSYVVAVANKATVPIELAALPASGPQLEETSGRFFAALTTTKETVAPSASLEPGESKDIDLDGAAEYALCSESSGVWRVHATLSVDGSKVASLEIVADDLDTMLSSEETNDVLVKLGKPIPEARPVETGCCSFCKGH